MGTWLKELIPAFGLIVAFVNIYFTYLLGIQAKYRDRDLSKENELNTVLANLLDVWYCLKNYEIAQKRIPVFEQQFGAEEILSKELATFAAYAAIKQMDDSCFEELDQSIKNLKKYDPITYFKHIDTGTRAKYFRSLSTFISYSGQTSLQATNELTIKAAIDDVKTSIDDVAELLSKKMVKQIKETLDHVHTDNELIEQFDHSILKFKEQVLPGLRIALKSVPADQIASLFTPDKMEELFNILSKGPEELGSEMNQAMSEMSMLLDVNNLNKAYGA